MRILVIGAGKFGVQVIQQLKKNEKFEILVADPHDEPEAIKKGVIDRLDFKVHITPLNFEEMIDKTKPDLVLLSRTVEDWEHESTHMGSQFVICMERELMKCRVPVLLVSDQLLSVC